MSEVVPFPESPDAEKRREAVEAREREQSRKAREEAYAREQRIALIARAEAAMKARPMMTKASERRAIARNLWMLLDTIEKGSARISKAAILVEAKQAKPEEPTKRIARYALRPGLPEAAEKKRSEELVQKIRIYVGIAKAAVALANAKAKAGEAKLDETEVVLQLLQGSSYLDEESAPQSDDPISVAAEHIAEHIRRAADRLSSHYDLTDFFATLDRHRLVLRADDGEKHDILGSWVVDVSVQARPFSLLPNVRRDDRDLALIHRCPTMHLGIVRTDEPTRFGVFAGVYSLDRECAVTLVVEAMPVWEVGLAIGPVGTGGTIAPFLVLQEKTWVVGDGADMFEETGFGSGWPERQIVGEHHGLCDEGRASLLAEEWGVADSRGRMEYASIFYCGSGEDGLKRARQLCRELDDQAPESDAGPNLAREARGDLEALALGDASADDSEQAERLCRRADLQDQRAVHPAPRIEVLPVSGETLKRILGRPRLLRHVEPLGAGATVWTDERRGGGFLDEEEYPFREFLTDADGIPNELYPDPPEAEPTTAPEGTLLALIERLVLAEAGDRTEKNPVLGSFEIERDTMFESRLYSAHFLAELDHGGAASPQSFEIARLTAPRSALERAMDLVVHHAVALVRQIVATAQDRLRAAALREPAAVQAPAGETAPTTGPVSSPS
jgi:hypothetical protein